MKKPKPQAPTTPHITPSGARRAGDYYQDARAAKFLVEWLNEPQKYRYVVLENDDAGSLDDITAQTQDGQWILIQVKYTTDTEANPLAFKDLLDKPRSKTGRTRSLLEKWSDSLRIHPPDQIRLATVETNRRAGDDLQKCLENGHVNLARVEPTIRRKIIEQLGEEKATELFSTFVFEVGLPGIDETEESGRRLLWILNPQCRDAWDSLMRAIRDWIVKPSSLSEDFHIDLHTVQTAARWFVLREIDERFRVPSDTMVPDDIVFRSILTELDAGSRVLQVIGEPGSGKSTLLTMFAETMKRQGHVVLRHHYFISMADTTERRYSAEVTMESLMQQIKEFGTGLLGPEEDRLSPDPRQPGELGSWLRSCASKMKERQHRLIVVIDGLDNAYRESPHNAQDELENVFQVLLPPPEGMYVVIGSQAIPQEQLPDALTSRVHHPRVKRMSRLSIDAVENWLEDHGVESMSVDPRVLESVERRHKLAVAIIDASGGLPLAFRLLQNQAMASELLVDEHSISRFPKVIDGNIEVYYSRLWARLSQVARFMLSLLAQFRWPWPISGIRQCMRRGDYSSGEVDNALSEIRYLLSQDSGPVTVFHTSLSWFVGEQPEFEEWKPRLTDTIVRWLENDAPDAYRRAHLWIIQASEQDTTELVNQPERSWLVDSLRHHTPRRYISQILEESGRNALKQHRFDVFARRSLLQDYVFDVFDYNDNGEGAVSTLLSGQLVRYSSEGLADLLEGEIKSLSDSEVHVLFAYLHEVGDRSGAGRCLEEIRDRIAGSGSHVAQFDDLSERLAYYADMQTCLPDASAGSLLLRIQGNRETVWGAVIAADYGKAILRHKQVALAHDLLMHTSELKPKEINGCFPWLYTLLIEQSSHMQSDVSSENLVVSSPWPHMLLVLSGSDYSEIPPVALPNAKEVFALDGFMRGDEPDRPRRIMDLFFSFFVSYATGHETAVQNWCDGVSSTEWLSTFVRLLAEAARNLSSQQSASGSSDNCIPLYAGFAELDSSPDNEQRGDSFLAGDCRKALVDIMFLSSCVNSSRGEKHEELEMATALRSSWFIPDRFVESLVDLDRIGPWSGVADMVCKSFTKNLHVEPQEGFMGCARRLALYSEFARQAGVEWKKLADLSCEYLVGYGWRKDIFMFDLLQCADELSLSAPDVARRILKKVSSPALSVLSFTDGSETHGLPDALGSTMISVCPDRILPYYDWLQNHERYRDAGHVFACWIQSSAFDTSWDCALGATSSDSESILELKKRCETDSRAQSVLAAVEERYGGVEGRIQPTDSEPPIAKTKTVEGIPDPSLYSPDRLEAFLFEARAAAWNEDVVAGWLQFWINNGRGQEAVSSLDRLYHRDWRRTNTGLETYLQIRSVVGRDAAFVWLVRANRGFRGWSPNFMSLDKSEALWKEVKTQFPENWFQFMEETVYDEESNDNIGTRGMLARLTRYLVLQGKTGAACDLAEGAAVLLEQLIPNGVPVELVRPEWLEQS